MKLKMASALLSLALLASPALAQDVVDMKVQELFAQGYTHFEISRGSLQTEIVAYGPDYTKLEMVISNSDGSVVSETTEVVTPEEYQQNVDEIAQSNDDDEGEDAEAADDEGDDGEGDDDEGGDDDGGDDEGGDDDGSDAGGDDDGGDDSGNGGASTGGEDSGGDSED